MNIQWLRFMGIHLAVHVLVFSIVRAALFMKFVPPRVTVFLADYTRVFYLSPPLYKGCNTGNP
jgi:hypothetical protein